MMVVDLILHVAVGIGLLFGGIYIGSRKTPVVTEAIAVIKSAEQDAQAVLAQITAHKAS